jgi:sigma-B regulation protein RsbU (phosphoserine phosphatase)
VLDPGKLRLTFANAGLCEPLHRSAGETEYIESPGSRLPLGVREDAAYQSTTVGLAEGDVVVLFTDGVPEAQNRDGELYGYEAPKRLLAGLDTDSCSPDEILQQLIDDVERFRNGAEASDDMAIVVISVTGSASSS